MPVKHLESPNTVTRVRPGYATLGVRGIQRGNPGRPKGSKDKGEIPKSVRASVKAICQHVATTKTMTIKRALVNGVNSSPAHADRYIKLIAEYVDGRPVDTMHLNAVLSQEEVSGAKHRLSKSMETLASAILARRKRSKERKK